MFYTHCYCLKCQILLELYHQLPILHSSRASQSEMSILTCLLYWVRFGAKGWKIWNKVCARGGCNLLCIKPDISGSGISLYSTCLHVLSVLTGTDQCDCVSLNVATLPSVYVRNDGNAALFVWLHFNISMSLLFLIIFQLNVLSDSNKQITNTLYKSWEVCLCF